MEHGQKVLLHWEGISVDDAEEVTVAWLEPYEVVLEWPSGNQRRFYWDNSLECWLRFNTPTDTRRYLICSEPREVECLDDLVPDDLMHFFTEYSQDNGLVSLRKCPPDTYHEEGEHPGLRKTWEAALTLYYACVADQFAAAQSLMRTTVRQMSIWYYG